MGMIPSIDEFKKLKPMPSPAQSGKNMGFIILLTNVHPNTVQSVSIPPHRGLLSLEFVSPTQ